MCLRLCTFIVLVDSFTKAKNSSYEGHNTGIFESISEKPIQTEADLTVNCME